MPFSAGTEQDCIATGTVGRHEASRKMLYFNKLCDWLEVTADQLYSISEPQGKMQETAGPGIDVYSRNHMQQLLLEHYEGHLVLSSVDGRNNVVCFHDMMASVMNDKWYSDCQSNLEDESRSIVTTAAKLIRSQIRDAKYQIIKRNDCRVVIAAVCECVRD